MPRTGADDLGWISRGGSKLWAFIQHVWNRRIVELMLIINMVLPPIHLFFKAIILALSYRSEMYQIQSDKLSGTEDVHYKISRVKV